MRNDKVFQAIKSKIEKQLYPDIIAKYGSAVITFKVVQNEATEVTSIIESTKNTPGVPPEKLGVILSLLRERWIKVSTGVVQINYDVSGGEAKVDIYIYEEVTKMVRRCGGHPVAI